MMKMAFIQENFFYDKSPVCRAVRQAVTENPSSQQVLNRSSLKSVILFSGQADSPLSLSPILRNSEQSPASPEFIQRINQAIHSLPLFLRTKLEESGKEVHVGKFLTDIEPDLKGKVPRGWDNWTTWDNSEAVNWGKKGRVSLAEFCWVSIKKQPSKFPSNPHVIRRIQYVDPPVFKPKNRLAKAIAVDRVFRHEIGHTFDDLLAPAGYHSVSETKAFRKAYQQDFARLTEEEKEIWHYYVQLDETGEASKGGYREAFAEALASVYGGGCVEVSAFKHYFQHTVAYVEAQLKVLEQAHTGKETKLNMFA